MSCQNRCCGKKSCMSSHYYINLYTAKRFVVLIISHKCHSYKSCGRTKARGMVIHQKVIIYSLWHMKYHKIITFSLCKIINNMCSLCRVISPYIEKVTYILRLKNSKDSHALLFSGLLSYRAKTCTRGFCYKIKLWIREIPQIYQVITQYSCYSMYCSI